MAYSRQSPSPRYLELLGFYSQMHTGGDEQLHMASADMFDGRSLAKHVVTILKEVKRFGAKTLLDYGAGKGKFYHEAVFNLPTGPVKGLKGLWALDEVRLYDPGYPPHAGLPTGQFDTVICTDVMEHIPEEDLSWVVGELFDYARKLVYVSIATYPADKLLPNGENAHVTLKSPDWWIDLFKRVRAERGAAAEFALVIEQKIGDPAPKVFTSYT